jgi:ATP synthase protein I
VRVAERNGFDDRLRQARARQGLDPSPEGRGKLPQGTWGVGFRAGVEVVSALVVGVGLGWFLDRWLGTWPWLFLLCFVLGGVAGVLNVYRLFDPRRGAGRRN